MQIVRRPGTFSHLNLKLHKEALGRRMACPYPPLTTAFNFATLYGKVLTAKKQSLSGVIGYAYRQNEPLDTGRCDLCEIIKDTAPLNIEKGGAVLYTLLRLASMQYMTKLAATQSQNPWSPSPPKI